MTTHTHDLILHALFELCRASHPVDATRLGRAAGQSATQTAEALVLLEQAGLVDASRARLTWLGLTRALRLDIARVSRPRELRMRSARKRGAEQRPSWGARPAARYTASA